jgi:hypothetical protein
MDTNAVLGLALTIISNFASVVHVAPESVPRDKDSVAVFTIGRRFFPLDMYLKDKRGDQFWIMHGVVGLYETPQSYFTLQDPNLIQGFVGTPKLSTNEVLQLCAGTMQRLVCTGDPLAHVQPIIRAAKPYHGRPVPFYEISWPTPENRILAIAHVEVDAANGVVVGLGVFDFGFDDNARVAQISNLVYKGDSPKEPPRQETNSIRLENPTNRPP